MSLGESYCPGEFYPTSSQKKETSFRYVTVSNHCDEHISFPNAQFFVLDDGGLHTLPKNDLLSH